MPTSYQGSLGNGGEEEPKAAKHREKDMKTTIRKSKIREKWRKNDKRKTKSKRKRRRMWMKDSLPLRRVITADSDRRLTAVQQIFACLTGRHSVQPQRTTHKDTIR
jgi:hypothetical protein